MGCCVEILLGPVRLSAFRFSGVVGVEFEASGQQIQQEVGAAGVHGAGVVGAEAAGQPTQPLVAGDRIRCAEQRPERGHSVLAFGQSDTSLPLRSPMAVGRSAGIGGDDGASQRGSQLGVGLLGRCREHLSLHGGCHLGGQERGRVADGAGLRRIQQAVFQQRQGRAEDAGEADGLIEADDRRTAGQPQRQPDRPGPICCRRAGWWLLWFVTGASAGELGQDAGLASAGR